MLKALLELVGVDREASFEELLEVCDNMGAPIDSPYIGFPPALHAPKRLGKTPHRAHLTPGR